MNGARLSALSSYQRAAQACDVLVGKVAAEQWEARTPCPDWNVRELVNHLASENRWMPPLLAGLTVADVGSQLDGDLLGTDPVGAWGSARAAAEAAAIATPRAGTVHVSFGDVPVEEYLWQLAADHLVHSWDLAAALGLDLGLETDLVSNVIQWFTAHESGYRDAGAIGPRVPVENDAGPQTRLLAMFGRSAPAPQVFAAVDRFGAAFDAKDVDGVMAAMTRDCVFESTAPPDGQRHVGQPEVRAAWTQFFAESAGATFTTEGRFACNDRVVVQWRYDWAGDDAGAEPGHVRGVDIFRVEDGLVAEKLSYVKG